VKDKIKKNRIMHFMFMPSRSKDEVELGGKRIGSLFLLKWSIGVTVLYVKTGTIPTYCMSFQRPLVLRYVHDVSIAHRSVLCKTTRPIIDFSLGK